MNQLLKFHIEVEKIIDKMSREEKIEILTCYAPTKKRSYYNKWDDKMLNAGLILIPILASVSGEWK